MPSQDVLKAQEVSSQLAGMLSSTDLKVLVGALQLASIFLEKLPHLFGIHFRREGVLHRVQNLKKGIGLGSSSSSSGSGPGTGTTSQAKSSSNASAAAGGSKGDAGGNNNNASGSSNNNLGAVGTSGHHKSGSSSTK